MAGASANQIAKLEQFAATERELAQIEAERTRLLGEVNAEADQLARPVLAEQAKLCSAIAVWWAKDGAALCPSGRKSIELGGCMIGSRAARITLGLVVGEDIAVAALNAVRWGKAFLRTKVSLDRAALLKALDGPRGGELKDLGLRADGGGETFFVARVAQAGTLSGAAG